MNVSRTVLDAALAYARGKAEQAKAKGVHISFVISVSDQGFDVIRSNARGETVRVPVSWHDVNYQQYDAFREAINLACVEIV